MAGYVDGLDCKLYYAVGGIGGTPTWVEVPLVKEPSLGLTSDRGELADRASIWKRYMKGQLDAPLTIRMSRKVGNSVYKVFRDAFLSRTTILGIGMASGTITTVGEEVFMADFHVFDFPITETIGTPGEIEVALGLAANSTNAPSFADVSA
jgi:hypothetical protein